MTTIQNLSVRFQTYVFNCRQGVLKYFKLKVPKFDSFFPRKPDPLKVLPFSVKVNPIYSAARALDIIPDTSFSFVTHMQFIIKSCSFCLLDISPIYFFFSGLLIGLCGSSLTIPNVFFKVLSVWSLQNTNLSILLSGLKLAKDFPSPGPLE